MSGRDSFLFSDNLPALRNFDFRTIAMSPDTASDESESIRQGGAVGHGGRYGEPTVAIDCESLCLRFSVRQAGENAILPAHFHYDTVSGDS